MKILTAQTLKDYKGKDISDGKEKLTLRTAISNSINAINPQKPMPAEQKNKAYQISIKLWSKKEINLTIDDMKFIKDKVGEIYGPLVYGRICDLFEGKK